MASKINRKKRIITDLQRLREPPESHLPKYDIRQEKANDLNVIYTEIRGPPDSYYSGGYFVIRFEFTNDYPVSSPSVAFATKIWHPNVDHNSGSVCLNSLNQNWQPTVNVRHILDTHMPWLLQNGNPDDPLNTDAGTQMKSKDPKYQNIVRSWVKKFASKSQLHSVGSVWYKDMGKAKRRKKKKKFSIAELTKKTQTFTPKKAKPKPETKLSKLSKLRKQSKSVGNIDDFSDWWTQTQILPNTPKKSPVIPRSQSQSFCVRPDSSPWNQRKDLSRTMSDPELICLDSTMFEQKNTVAIPSKVAFTKHRRKKKHKSIENNESDLSSMDEDPIYDLETYQSLTSQTPSHNYCGYSFTQTHTKPLNHRSNANHKNTNQRVINSVESDIDIYSKSDGFIPQINTQFICPEFSPLSPAKPMLYSHRSNNDKILHFAPVNTQYTNGNGNGNGSDTDVISDNDDDDMPLNMSECKIGKTKQKLVDIDIDMSNENTNVNMNMALD